MGLFISNTDLLNSDEGRCLSIHSSSTMSVGTVGPSSESQDAKNSLKTLCRSVNDLHDLHKAAQDTRIALLYARGWSSDQSLYPDAHDIHIRSHLISQESLTDPMCTNLQNSKSIVREFLSANSRDRKPVCNVNNNHTLKVSNDID